MKPTIGIGVLGAGTVGGAVVSRLIERRQSIAARYGIDLNVRRIAVKHLDKPRPFDAPETMTDEPEDVVEDRAIDIVIEAIGGTNPAASLLRAALRSGKPVVTANKELVAKHGAELFDLADRHGAPLLYEAAVGGGMPVIRAIEESLAGEEISRVEGILNGTSNYILSQMSSEGISYHQALSQAMELGFAEADPEDDVSGIDTVFKVSILSRVAFGAPVPPWDIPYEGIESLSLDDLEQARRNGEVIRLVASATRDGENQVSAEVRLRTLGPASPLASIDGVTNAVLIEGPAIGRLLLSGPGAGGGATASAMIGDLIQVASRPRSHRPRPARPGLILHR